MSIGLTTVILFAVFGILLFFKLAPFPLSIVIASIVAAMSSLSWDQITFITMQKMNSGVESFFSACHPTVHPCRKHYE